MFLVKATRLIVLLSVFVAVSAQAETKTVPATQNQIVLSYAPLVKETAPAVVNIYTSKTIRSSRRMPLFDDPFFRRFFGDQAQRSVPGPKRKVQNSLGSGVLISPAGLAVTNVHVLEGAEEIKVVLNDRREFSARVLGKDKRTDLALIQLALDNGEHLPFLKPSDSDKVEVGDLVLAIGNPFGVGQTVTSGIVSALSRRSSVSDLNSFIQTDAAINPGNSGGALVDVKGRLIGINTAIFTKTGASHGIGFAIPANMVTRVVSSLVTNGNVVRPWLGARGQGVSADIAESIGMKRPYGVMITSVYPGGPAARSGMKLGDILLTINDKEIRDGQDLRFKVATLPAQGFAKLGVMRRGGLKQLTIALEAPPAMPPKNETMIRGRNPFQGAVVANLSPKLADELGFVHEKTGVIVMALERKGNASRIGFERGDIILQVNGTDVVNVRTLLGMVGKTPTAWIIRIERDGQERNIVIR
ncbi:Do family serine endopeptidase [Magnetovibrio sp. PR-2]|uniref:Do family serine endopeptidase n=1 Tax=Magnetovibrio sp. PR-2 TaxID=3120356 RepID=UPI002FCE4CBD